jgi:CheY-like chemotaxis protein
MPDSPRILLVGPQVSRLGNFVEERGYMAVCREDGRDALSFLEGQECDLVVIELEMGELVAREFMKEARRHRPDAGFLLVEDPAKAHRIVAAMVHGVFAFVPAPPEDEFFFRVVKRLIAATSEDTQALEDRIAQLQLEVRALKSKKSGDPPDDRTRDVFADTAFDEDDVDSIDDSEIKVAVHEHKTRAIDVEFEKLATQMMPAQKRVRGSEEYRRVVESTWARVPDTNPESGS